MASTNIQTFPGKVGVSNTNPIHTLDIGSNVYIDDTAQTKLRIIGNIHASGVTVDGTITAIDSENLSVKDPIILLASGSTGTSDTGIIMKRADGDSNVAVFYDEGVGLKIGHTLSTAQDIHISVDSSNSLSTSIYGPVTVAHSSAQALVVQGGAEIADDFKVGASKLFVDVSESNVGIGTDAPLATLDVHGTANVGALTVVSISGDGSGLSSIQSSNVSDFASNVTRIGTLETDLGSNVTRIGTLETDLGSNVTRIGTLETDLGSNVTRITNLESSDMTIGGEKTFSSNLTVGGDVTVTDTTSGSAAGPEFSLYRNQTGTNGDYLGQLRFDGKHDGGNNQLFGKITGKIKTATSGNERGIIETTLVTDGTQRISVRHSGDLFHIKNGTDLQVGETANLYVDTATSRVGVNTSSPAYTLDVHGTAAIVSEQPPSALTASGVNNIDKHGNFRVSSSSDVNATYANWKAFSKTTAAGTDTWASGTSVYGGTDNAHNGTASINSISGEWLRLDLPYATTLRYFTMTPTNDVSNTPDAGVAQFPKDFQLLGSSDDGASWTSLKSVTGQTASSVTNTKTIHVNAAARYRSYAVVVTKTANNSLTSIGELKLFAESFSVNEGVVELRGMESGFMEHPLTPFTGSTAYSSVVGSDGVFEPTSHFVEGHGTYEASASTSYNAGGQAQRPAWHLFDRSSSTYYQNSAGTGFETYATSSPYAYNGSRNTTTVDVGGDRHVGVWVQLKVPRAFALAHTKFTNTSNMTDRAPNAGVLLGSNDGVAWYKLTEFSSLTYSSNEASVTVNATTPYQYFRMVVTNTVGASSVNFTGWRLFAEKPVTKLENVHISGDLSSETLQTGYIKWPRKSLKANESEGYVASASSTYSSTSYLAHYAFDDTATIDATSHAWLTAANTFDTTTGAVDSTYAATFDGLDCHWIQLQSPQAFAVSHFDFDRRESESYSTIIPQETPKEGYLYASNDSVHWTRIHSFSDLPKLGPQDWHRIDVKNSTPYTHYRLVVTKIHPGNLAGYCGISNLRFFEAATGVGAPPTSAKLQVHGSLGMAKGSSLFAGDSVVADFPKHDRPLVKYPEVKMTAASMAGYTSSASGTPNPNHAPYDAFNNVGGNTNDSWHSETSYATSGSRESTTSTLSTWTGGGGGHNGAWLKIQLPNKIVLKRIILKHRTAVGGKQHPRLFSVVGSNDDSRWYLVHEETSRTSAPNPDPHTMLGPYASTAWKYFAVVIRTGATNNNYNHVAIGDWELYGTEEGDESVDVVHRSVPNKPGTQQLSVWIDPGNKDSYSLGDNSKTYDLVDGRAGNLYGNKVFDPEFNSFYLDASGDDIDGTITTTTGAWVHSISCWVKNDTVNYASGELFALGTANGSQMVGLRFNGTDVMRYYFYSNDVIFHVKNNSDRWLHVVATYDGGSSAQANEVVGVNRKLYVNGEECLVQATTSVGALNLQASSHTYYVGRAIWSGAQQKLKGYYGGLRVYNKVLSREQVLELFDEGAERFGLREDLVSVHKGNLGIGLRDPEQRLVVAGSLQEFPPGAMTSEYTHFTGHGIFRATASSVYQGNSVFAAYTAFDNTTSGFWHSAVSYSSASGYNPHTGSQKITAGDGTEYSGEYIQLSMPYQIHLKRIAVSPRITNYNRGPHTATLLARRNSGDDWVVVASWGGLVWTTTEASNGVMKYIEVNSEQSYSEFVMVVHVSNDSVNLSQITFFGVPQMNVTDGRQLNVGQVMTGSIYAPGHPVQYVGENVNDIVSYGSTSGGRYVTPLDVTITPKFSNSKIFVQWVINFEAHQDMVFRVYRGSTLIGYNTSIANNRWNGVSTPDFDQNNDSTPGQSTISWIDSPNTTSAVTYRVYAQSSDTSSKPFYLNRTYGSSDTGQNSYERMVSYKSAMEIAV